MAPTIPGISENPQQVLFGDFLSLILELDNKEQSKIVDRANIISSRKAGAYELDVNTALCTISLLTRKYL